MPPKVVRAYVPEYWFQHVGSYLAQRHEVGVGELLEPVWGNVDDRVLPNECHTTGARKEVYQVPMMDAALPREWEPCLPGDRLRTPNVELGIEAGVATAIDVLETSHCRVKPLLNHHTLVFYSTAVPPGVTVSTECGGGDRNTNVVNSCLRYLTIGATS